MSSLDHQPTVTKMAHRRLIMKCELYISCGSEGEQSKVFKHNLAVQLTDAMASLQEHLAQRTNTKLQTSDEMHHYTVLPNAPSKTAFLCSRNV